MSGLKLAIWDVDGTLVDSRTSIHEIMVEAFTLSALTPPEYDATRRIVGLSLHEACGQLAPDANAAEIDRLEASGFDAPPATVRRDYWPYPATLALALSLCLVVSRRAL